MIDSVQIGLLPRQEKDLRDNRSRWFARNMDKGRLAGRWTKDFLMARSVAVKSCGYFSEFSQDRERGITSYDLGQG
jgi:hypothetical protein